MNVSNNLLQSIFLYFAKYPAHKGVMQNFNLNNSVREDYQAFKKAAEDLPVRDVFKNIITDYVFGVNEESVKKRISSISGVYLFVDYGNVTSIEDDRRVKHDDFNLALTLAKPTSANSLNSAEEVLLVDELLNTLRQIRADMRADRDNPFIKALVFPNEITPFFAREMSNSYGWTLMFKMQGVDLV